MNVANTTTILTEPRRDRQHDAERQDTSAAANARVALKLAAEGYSASRHGSDAGGRLTSAALFVLRSRAIQYYARLERIDPGKKLPADLHELHEHPLVDQAFGGLQAAALAYSGTRSGADASLEFTRAAIAEICSAAIFYVESMMRILDHEPNHSRGARKRADVTEAVMALGDGT